MTIQRHHRQIRTALRGLLLTIVLWAILAALAEWRGATWPVTGDDWQNLLLLAVIVEFLLLKSYLMAFMTTRWDLLGGSLIAVNVAFALVYLYALGLTLFPAWAITHAKDGRYPIRYGLIAVLVFGFIQLLRVPDREDEPEPIVGVREPTSLERTATATEEIAAQGHRKEIREMEGGS
jgi:hypothetical protein